MIICLDNTINMVLLCKYHRYGILEATMNKKSILTQIFYLQEEALCCDEKYNHANTQLCENDKIISAALKNDEMLLKNYKAVIDAQDEYEAIAVKEFYGLVFKSGFKLAMEIFNINIDYFAD